MVLSRAFKLHRTIPFTKPLHHACAHWNKRANQKLSHAALEARSTCLVRRRLRPSRWRRLVVGRHRVLRVGWGVRRGEIDSDSASNGGDDDDDDNKNEDEDMGDHQQEEEEEDEEVWQAREYLAGTSSDEDIGTRRRRRKCGSALLPQVWTRRWTGSRARKVSKVTMQDFQPTKEVCDMIRNYSEP